MMEYKLFGVCFVSKEAVKKCFKLKNKTKRLNVNLSYPDKSQPQSTRLLQRPQPLHLSNEPKISG